MGIDGVGSSVIVALAAVLWFIYLVPTWLRRREYLATERNAVRLQQTLRVMAETAQVPEAVRIEAHARAIAAQERALRARRAALGETGPVERVADAHGDMTPERVPSGSSASRRLRRSRLVTTLVLLASLVGVGFGVAELAASGGGVLAVVSGVVAVGALALLRQMAAVARMRRESGRVRHAPVAQSLYDDAEHGAEHGAAESADRGWVPQPLPRPLYLEARERAAEVAASAAAAPAVSASAHVNRVAAREELALAAAEAEEKLRAEQPPRVQPREAAGSAPESRFARMGILDEQDASPTDLDEILARRRAVS